MTAYRAGRMLRASDALYTEDDLRHEAARQHAILSGDPDFTGVGEMMTGQSIPSTVVDLEPHIGEPYEMSRAWHFLGEADFENAQHAISRMIGKAANTSAYAVDCGAEGLAPAGHHQVYGEESGSVRAAFHVALDPHLELAPRTYQEIADIIRNNLTFREEGA